MATLGTELPPDFMFLRKRSADLASAGGHPEGAENRVIRKVMRSQGQTICGQVHAATLGCRNTRTCVPRGVVQVPSCIAPNRLANAAERSLSKPM